MFRVERLFDLVISESSSSTNATLPAAIAYKVVALNNGQAAIPNVVLTHCFVQSEISVGDPWSLITGADDTPQSESGLSVTSVTVTQGTWQITGQRIRLEIGNLAAGALVEAEITVKGKQDGLVYHLVQGTSAGADPDLRNNSAFSKTLVGDAAALSIRVLPRGDAELSWPSTPAGYVLQASDGVSIGSWITLPNQGLETNGWRRVQEPLRLSRFYRMIRQPSPGSEYD